MASTGIQASKPEVRMADKIAMRSLVLSKTLPRIGGQCIEPETNVKISKNGDKNVAFYAEN
jgi:hypothetical protein